MSRTFILLFILPSFLLLSCSQEDNQDSNTEQVTTSGMVIDVPDGVPQTAGSSFRGESAWDAVRGSANWGDANSQIMDGILVELLNSGLLTRTATYTDTNVMVNDQQMTIRLTVGTPTTVSTASAFSGSKTYDNKFEVWRNSDVQKAMELYFDSASELGEDGALLYYKLKVLAPEEFDGDNVVVESYAFETSEGRKQTYTWSGGAIEAGGTGDSGRVILEEMDNNTVFCFKAVVKLNTSSNICPASSGVNEYYSLGYTQKLEDDGEVTAKFGFEDSVIDNTGMFCGATNTFNYGIFNNDGFISDMNSSVPATHPTTTRVDGLFSEINTTGAGEWDDTSQSKIDGLNIQFVSTAAP